MMSCPTLTTFTPSSSASKCVHRIFNTISTHASKCPSIITCVWVPSLCHHASNGLHDLCKGIKVFIRGSKSSSRFFIIPRTYSRVPWHIKDHTWSSSSYKRSITQQGFQGHHQHKRAPSCIPSSGSGTRTL